MEHRSTAVRKLSVSVTYFAKLSAQSRLAQQNGYTSRSKIDGASRFRLTHLCLDPEDCPTHTITMLHSQFDINVKFLAV